MSEISFKKVFMEPQLSPQGSWQDLTGTWGRYNTSGGYNRSGKKWGGWERILYALWNHWRGSR